MTTTEPDEVTAPFDPRPWQDDALCKETDPELFFPDTGGSTRAAKAVCMRCPVRVECLLDAMQRKERYGIFGGLTENERRKLAKTS